MARNIKKGFPYFPKDTEFWANRKIKRLVRNFGAQASAVYDFILCEIYKEKGYFLERDENTAFDVADALKLKESYVEEVIDYCATVGLFNKELLRRESIFTSNGIQERCVEMSLKRTRLILIEEYCIIEPDIPNWSKLEIKYLSLQEYRFNNSISESKIRIPESETTQSKVKKSKVKNNLKEEGELQARASPSKQERKTISDQVDEIWLTSFSRTPKLPEREETEKLLRKFEFEIVKREFKSGVIAGAKGLRFILNRFDLLEKGINPNEHYSSHKAKQLRYSGSTEENSSEEDAKRYEELENIINSNS